ncbi:YbaB/EbfC family nucleoid-associated protein [Buchnera aphidicola (Sarucallis kahawaluokalani)]|uniref:Nucleoid-associated protein D9V78_01615 n=2 Tax=Buchnera aphidicola TaxID=9 RepID=A0A4D6Y9M7_9GAMM|nr:YbaB/EbfC family nucleoid-associated protein [Buchnera aphidicola (Sarucallis kahawaluokalani)]
MFDANNINNFMKQAKEIQEKMKNVQKSINIMKITGESGAGLVQITLNGKYHCIKVKIDNSLLKKSEKNILEDLITAAFNDANKKINEERKNKISNINPGIPLPNDINLMI